MDEEKSSENIGQWLAQKLSGGIPQIIAGPAGAAISRLIGGAVDIPAAWLEQKAQSIRDETQAKAKVMQALAKHSAALGLKDDALLQRGLDNLLGRAYREQENREEVAKRVFEQLRDDPALDQDIGPNDDWMNVFEGQAAKASSETMRDLYSRVLAGEIRKPGSFSLSTMHLLSILDKPIAELIEELAPLVWDNNVVLKYAVDQKIQYGKLLALEEAGILMLGSGMLSLTKKINDGYINFTSQNSVMIAYYATSEFENFKDIQVYTLTRGARELVSILSVTPDLSLSASALWESGAQKVQVGTKTRSETGGYYASNLQDIPKA